MTNMIFKTLIIYFSLLLAMRLLGKRQLGEMELSECVVAALIADVASIPLQDLSFPVTRGLVPIFVLYCCELMISVFSMKSLRLRALLFGKPSLLVIRGQINQAEMRKNRFTCDELMQELRTQGMMDISKIQYAILETDGKLNIINFPDENPVTAAQLGITSGEIGYPLIIVSDGRTLTDNLKHLNKDEAWLKKELNSRHIRSAKDVFLMTADQTGKLFI